VNSRYYAKKKAALTNVLPTPVPSKTLGSVDTDGNGELTPLEGANLVVHLNRKERRRAINRKYYLKKKASKRGIEVGAANLAGSEVADFDGNIAVGCIEHGCDSDEMEGNNVVEGANPILVTGDGTLHPNPIEVENPMVDVEEVEGRRASNRRYYLKRKAAKATIKDHNGACGNDAGTSLHANIEVGHVEDTFHCNELCIGDSPSRIIEGSCVSELLTTNTNASSCLQSDISLLDALVGEEGQVFPRVNESRRSKNRKHYAKRQACNPTDSEVTFSTNSVEDRRQFGGIYCANWDKAKELLYNWLQYCKEFFGNAKACANCGKFVFGGKYSMHYGKFIAIVFRFRA
jgi:hypothetical protein